jgi:hypothetical protein
MAKTAIYGKTASPGGLFAIEDQSLTTGNRFYVDSGASNVGSTASYGKSPEAPLASLALAFSLDILTANNGDVVYLMPGHTENVAAAAGIACDIAGVKVVGLGDRSDRPTITFITDTAATMTVTAASVSLENIRFVCDIDAMVVGIPVTAAYCQMINCEFIDNGTDNALYWVSLSAAADDFLMIDCKNKGTATAGNTAFITMAAVSDVEIINLKSNGNFSAANIECTAAPVNILIEGARLENAHAVDVCIEGFAAASGMLVDCLVRIATDTETTGINTAGALSLFGCYQINNDAESGLLIGAPSV